MNLLLQDTEITGKLSFVEELAIHGKLMGEITSSGALTVGETGYIKGDIKTKSAVIYGKVEGTITVQERCELKPTADVVGDISAGTFTLEEGACFSGLSKVGKRAPTK
jgi:cytoskeletal protein CcmA (bactofilin family)